MSQHRTLRELFHERLKTMLFAENQILDALPRMATAARSGKLRATFENHETQTREHITRLKDVFRELGETPHTKHCAAITGAIQDGQEIALDYKGTQVLDAALMAVAQSVEHYEIALYGTLKTWAEQLGLAQSADRLNATLVEEKQTDEKLSELAKSEMEARADPIPVYPVVGRDRGADARRQLAAAGTAQAKRKVHVKVRRRGPDRITVRVR